MKLLKMLLIAVLVAAAGTIVAGAGELLQPILDTPLRDPHVCRGPDGTFYLTGTSGVAGDFETNAGVRLWKSRDLKTWEDLGLVFELPKDGGLGYAQFGFLRVHRARPGNPDTQRTVRGVTAPEIHFAKDTFWIAASQNGYGTFLLKSTTGKAEGPYKFHAVITSLGDDPSIFQDDDGKLYWLWSPAWIAPLKDDLTGLSGPPQMLTCKPNSKMGDDILLGDRAPFLFKKDKRYYLMMGSTARERLGIITYDTVVGAANTLTGPYSQREILVPHSGQANMFDDGQGNWFATFAGRDRYAAFTDKPGIVPLDWVRPGDVKGHNKFNPSTTLPRWRKSVFTVRGPWWKLRPLIDKKDLRIRDMNMMQAPDGTFCFTGSVHGEPYRARLVIFTSKDLKNWKEIEVCRLADVQQVSPERRQVRNSRGWDDFFMDAEPFYRRGEKTWYVRTQLYDVKGLPDKQGKGAAMLFRSKTGNVEGPYEYWGDSPSQGSYFEDEDGTVYCSMGGGAIYRMNPDLRGWKEIIRNTVPPGGGGLCEDAGGDVIKILGQWVHFTTGISGGHWCNNPSGATSLLTYDFHYLTADKPEGPWSLGATPGIPFGGHGGVFQGVDGRYYGVVWGDDTFAPFEQQPGLVRLTTEMKNGRLHIDVDPDWTPADYKSKP